MTRDLRRLADATFDLVVVGGGVQGAAAAWDAAQRGLSVALVDRGDFGGGTSLNSAKTIHGGVRALRSADLAELRLFVRERRALSRLVPHLVHPLPFVIPARRGLARNRWLLRAGFAAYDLLSRGRNVGVDPSLRLPPSRPLSRAECLALSPMLDPDGVTGGVEWFDCQMHNSDRVTLAFVRSAVRAGADAANYAEAVDLVRRGARVGGVQVVDRLGGARFDVRAPAVLNCAGPWAPELLRKLAPEAAPALPRRMSKAMNLVTDRPLADTHAWGSWADGRLIFIAPWRGRSIVGTGHEPFDGAADGLGVRRREVETFLGRVNRAFPGAELRAADVTLAHRGLLPSRDGVRRRDTLRKTSIVADHRADGLAGLISVLGVRYTTARATAQRAVDAVFELLGRPAPLCRTADTPLDGGDVAHVETLLRSAERAAAGGPGAAAGRRLARAYGSRCLEVLEALRGAPGDARPLGASCAVTRGEVRHAVRREMAVKLSDAVLRRTEAGSAGHPGGDALRAAAEVMGAELGWTAARTDAEIAEAETAYAISD